MSTWIHLLMCDTQLNLQAALYPQPNFVKYVQLVIHVCIRVAWPECCLMLSRCLGVMPVNQAAALSRDELEAGLNLLALLLFRKELKADNAEAITHLKGGQVAPAALPRPKNAFAIFS